MARASIAPSSVPATSPITVSMSVVTASTRHRSGRSRSASNTASGGGSMKTGGWNTNTIACQITIRPAARTGRGQRSWPKSIAGARGHLRSRPAPPSPTAGSRTPSTVRSMRSGRQRGCLGKRSRPFAGMTRIRFEGFGRQAISVRVANTPRNGWEHRSLLPAPKGKRYSRGRCLARAVSRAGVVVLQAASAWSKARAVGPLLEGQDGPLAGLVDEGQVDPVAFADHREIGRDVAPPPTGRSRRSRRRPWPPRRPAARPGPLRSA